MRVIFVRIPHAKASLILRRIRDADFTKLPQMKTA